MPRCSARFLNTVHIPLLYKIQMCLDVDVELNELKCIECRIELNEN